MNFATQVLTWFDKHGRKDLPWQQNKSAYSIWISEIMLQQTQVNTVIPYFQKFTRSFPDIFTLANASLDEVLKHWSGLGYYARARNLHKTAQTLCNDYTGKFPTQLAQVEALSGIGRSTAGAILSLAFNQSHAILDGNVKRVLCRYHAVIGWSGTSKIQKELWQYAEQHLPTSRNADYTQAMMDLGAMICLRSKPLCPTCPLKQNCLAYLQNETTIYPYKKPKKVLPRKTAIMLVLKNSTNEILLFKRPPTGIWGGLWSLPEFDSNTVANEWLETYFKQNFSQTDKQMEIQHTFTHFHLTIEVFILKIENQPTSIMEGADYFWHHLEKELSGGVATPVQKILNALNKPRQGHLI